MTNNAKNNKRNDRRKFLEKLKQPIPTKWDNNVVWWVKTSKTLLWDTFHVVLMLMDSFQRFFKFNQKLALKIICITKTFRRQVCFCITLSLILVYNKWNYGSLLYRSFSVSVDWVVRWNKNLKTETSSCLPHSLWQLALGKLRVCGVDGSGREELKKEISFPFTCCLVNCECT